MMITQTTDSVARPRDDKRNCYDWYTDFCEQIVEMDELDEKNQKTDRKVKTKVKWRTMYLKAHGGGIRVSTPQNLKLVARRRRGVMQYTLYGAKETYDTLTRQIVVATWRDRFDAMTEDEQENFLDKGASPEDVYYTPIKKMSEDDVKSFLLNNVNGDHERAWRSLSG